MKWTRLLVSLFVVTALLASCGGSDDADSASSSDSDTSSDTSSAATDDSSGADDAADEDATAEDSSGDEAPAENVVVTMLHSEAADNTFNENWFAQAEEILAPRGITLDVSLVPNADVKTRITAGAAAGNLPCVISITGTDVTNFSPAFIDLDPLVESEGFDLSAYSAGSTANLVDADGKRVALPFDFGPFIMFYNKDLFAEAGVAEPQSGWTAAEWEQTMRDLGAAGVTAYTGGPFDYQTWTPIYAYNGAQWIKDGMTNLEDPLLLEGLTWYKGLYTDGLFAEIEGANHNPGAIFERGETAMYADGPWMIETMGNIEAFEVGAVSMPDRSLGFGTGFGISRDCDVPEEAFAAIAALISEVPQNTGAEIGRFYPALNAAQPAFYGAFPWVEEAMSVTIENASSLGSSPDFSNVSPQYNTFAYEFLTSDQTAEEFVDTVMRSAG